jgi:DNA (cytosine-5)-methyltransferase 1
LVARALGDQIRRALDHEGTPRALVEQSNSAHDPVYAVLRHDGGFLTMEQILRRVPEPLDVPAFERHLSHLRQDFHIDVDPRKTGDAYRLADFKAFVGQDDHLRHKAFIKPSKISWRTTRHARQRGSLGMLVSCWRLVGGKPWGRS